jgi:hypothetical protein
LLFKIGTLEASMQQHRTPRALAGALLALLLLPAMPIGAQQGRLGRISGKVSDGGGEPIPDVKITITTKSNSKFRKELTSGKDGTWATFLNDTTQPYHYRFEKPGYLAVEKDKKVPLWNPNDDVDVHGRSADFSVLDIQLFAQAPAAKDGK